MQNILRNYFVTLLKWTTLLGNFGLVLLIDREYLHIFQPTAWGIVFTSFVAILALANINIIIKHFTETISSREESFLKWAVFVFSIISAAGMLYFLNANFDKKEIELTPLVLGGYSLLAAMFSALLLKKGWQRLIIFYHWYVFLGNIILWLLMFMHITNAAVDDENFLPILIIAFISTLNLCFAARYIWEASEIAKKFVFPLKRFWDSRSIWAIVPRMLLPIALGITILFKIGVLTLPLPVRCTSGYVMEISGDVGMPRAVRECFSLFHEEFWVNKPQSFEFVKWSSDSGDTYFANQETIHP